MISFACFDVPEDRPGIDVLHRMRAEQEARHHAEIAAAAAQRPEQIRVLSLARRDEAAVGQHHVGLEQIVDRQPVLARADSRCRRRASARRRRWSRRCPPAPRGRRRASRGRRRPACSRARRARCARPDRRACPSARDRSITRPSSQLPRPGPLWPPPRIATSRPCSRAEVHRRDDVGDVGAARDQPRPLVDHRVVERARLVVVGVSAAGSASPRSDCANEAMALGVEHGQVSLLTLVRARGRGARPILDRPPARAI